ncbi:hypothetical protein SD71_13085 [Cohnella kolymensis]|uniref:Hrp-dependent type III effector protein n=1 Tax=Cohnella kolymensis TaxID=1590652 RepID=A0ABR5A319_9BACL|nr:four-carbon acid sugar kinase family protein [Cohnella kolymensis]KIL35458.1 hypothetical protein SD71_13085 [Cohnella kolymensis]
MNVFYIIADDLTGASDSGVQFAKRGYKTSLLFNYKENYIWSIDARVIVIDSDSRAIPPEAAYERVARLVSVLRPPSAQLLFKKVDSTLRGNIQAEVKAVLDTLPQSTAFIVPAYPKNGRTTRNGNQLLRGVPVHETEIGQDPKTPVFSSFIPDLFDDTCAVIDTASTEKGLLYLENRIRELISAGNRRIVFDAESNEHLETIGRLYSRFPDAVWVGSAGIAEYLNPPLPMNESDQVLPKLRKPLLFLIGSLSESTRMQVEACSIERFFTLRLDPVLLLEKDASELLPASLFDAYRAGKHCIVALDSTEQARQSTAAFAEARKLPKASMSELLREALGKMSKVLVSELAPECLFLSGGDTARSICEHLDIAGMNILQELEPGIPLGRVAGKNFHLVTKAGAFGNARSFENIAEQLTKE